MTPNKNHYRWYNDMTTGLTIFPDQESRSLESLLFEYAHGEEGDECLDEPYEGAGYCVCAVCQVLAPIAAELERQYQELTAENEALQEQMAFDEKNFVERLAAVKWDVEQLEERWNEEKDKRQELQAENADLNRQLAECQADNGQFAELPY